MKKIDILHVYIYIYESNTSFSAFLLTNSLLRLILSYIYRDEFYHSF